MIKHFRAAFAAALLAGAGLTAHASLVEVKTSFYSPDLSTLACAPQTGLAFDGAQCSEQLPFTLSIDTSGEKILVLAGGQFAGPTATFAGFVIEVTKTVGTVFGTVALLTDNFDGNPTASIDGAGRLQLNFANLLWDGGEDPEAVGFARFSFSTTTANAVPEPATLGLVGLAMAALGMAGHRRRRA